MRLIDADALNLDYEVDMADDWKTAHEISNYVKYAPTVEAIPIDWLKKKYFNKRTIYSDRSLARQMAVKELIKEWEDESHISN